MDGRRMEREGERARYPKREEKEEEEEEEDQEEETTTNNSIYIYIYQPTLPSSPSTSTNITLSKKTFTNLISHHPKNQPPQKMQFFALLATAALAAAAPSVLETRGGEKVCASGAPYCCQLDVLGVAAVSCSDGKYLTSLPLTLRDANNLLFSKSPEAPSPSTNSTRSASTRD